MSQRKLRGKRDGNTNGKHSRRRVVGPLVAAGVVVGFLAFLSGPSAQISVAADTGVGPSVTRVDPAYVCMVNDRSYPQPQIAVPVDERTYYGCCEMCKTTLAESTKHRKGIDPVTGNSVDKSRAVIGALPDGRVHYFEDESSFRVFSTGGGS